MPRLEARPTCNSCSRLETVHVGAMPGAQLTSSSFELSSNDMMTSDIDMPPYLGDSMEG